MMTIRVGILVCICSLGLILTPAAAQAQAQARWSWPDSAENLQVLPADFSGTRLRAVMNGFTRALGVRCSHCHVGEEGQPLSTFDFPSDDNPNKETARTMLGMLGDINETLKTIEPTGDQRVNMWCHTCHRGRPRPMTLGEELSEAYRAEGVDMALERYAELRERFYGHGSYDFSENALNALGYEIMGDEDFDAAIAIFALNIEMYPESGNVYDSLGEAYMNRGDTELAIANYERSLELDPDNDNAVQMLEELRAN